MPPIDVPWAVYNENLDMATGSVPLQDLGPPPEYESSPKKGTMDSIHNHYYTQYPQKPWYRRKRFFYPLIGVVLLVVITCATVLGVMLKDKPANDSTEDTKTVISPSSGLLTSPPGSPTTGGKQSSSPTTTKARATATPFTIADNSQLATAFAKNKDARLDRRLMIRQEDTEDLHVTEWVNGTINRYRIKERVASLGAEAKSGTPIALEVDSKGLAHLFFLGKTNIISYMYEKEAGKWESGEVANEKGAIRTSSSSSLSTAWHKGRNTPELLVVAYDNPSQKLQLAITDSPTDRASWYLTDVTSVAVEPVAGQSNLPCYSLAGDWYNKTTKTDKDGFQYLLIGVLQKNEVVPWECAIDFWPPPDVQIQCRQADKAFYSEYCGFFGTFKKRRDRGY